MAWASSRSKLILAVFHVLERLVLGGRADGQLAVGNKGVALIGRGVGGGGTRCRGARSATTGERQAPVIAIATVNAPSFFFNMIASLSLFCAYKQMLGEGVYALPYERNHYMQNISQLLPFYVIR